MEPNRLPNSAARPSRMSLLTGIHAEKCTLLCTLPIATHGTHGTLGHVQLAAVNRGVARSYLELQALMEYGRKPLITRRSEVRILPPLLHF